MPNSLQSSAIASPASRRATNCSLSSITERSFQGIIPSSLEEESVTHVSGTKCYLCLRPLTYRFDLSTPVWVDADDRVQQDWMSRVGYMPKVNLMDQCGT